MNLIKKILIASAALSALMALPVMAQSPSGVTEAQAPGGLLEAIVFYIVALLVCGSAIGVCCSKNIVRMAVWLFVTLGGVSMTYFLLASNFLGAIQLIVYAGGTLVLLVFGVMLTSKSPWARFEVAKLELVAAGAVAITLGVSLCTILTRTEWHSVEGVVPGATMDQIGKTLLTTYLVPFEVAGVLLMVVMVGAAHLARQEKN